MCDVCVVLKCSGVCNGCSVCDVYVCMYIYMYMYVYACMCVMCMYVCALRLHTCIYIAIGILEDTSPVALIISECAIIHIAADGEDSMPMLLTVLELSCLIIIHYLYTRHTRRWLIVQCVITYEEHTHTHKGMYDVWCMMYDVWCMM